MSDNENRWKWNKFVEIGNTIHKMRGQVRIQKAVYALQLSAQLLENHFIINFLDRNIEILDSRKIFCKLI